MAFSVFKVILSESKEGQAKCDAKKWEFFIRNVLRNGQGMNYTEYRIIQRSNTRQ